MMRFARLLGRISTLLLATCGMSALAQVTPPKDITVNPVAISNSGNPGNQDLYLEAMQAIAEGRKNDASHYLQLMIGTEPQHAGAWLDLALIQCELGKNAEAQYLFLEIERRFAPPAEIMQIINLRRQLGCAGQQPKAQWNVLLARGYEQNVNQGASNPFYSISNANGTIEFPLLPDFLPKADHYTLLSADYVRQINQNGSLLFSQFQGRRNDVLSQYDSASLFLGLEQVWRLGRWGVRGTALLGAVGLGGQLYQKQTQLQLKITPPLPLPQYWQAQISFGSNHLQYLTLTNFDANTFEARGQILYQKEDRLASASIAWLNDHATDARPGGRRNGWQANVQGRLKLPQNVFAELSWSKQTWNGQSHYSPGFIDQVRNQQMQTLRAALIYPWSERQSLQLEVRQVWNRENISIFQYNNRQIQLSWLWQNR